MEKGKIIFEAIDYDAVDRGEGDFEHWFCSMECAEQAGYEEKEVQEMEEKEVSKEDKYICENCGTVIKKKGE